MYDLNIGKGVYLWDPRQLEGADPQKILERYQLAGIQSVVMKICDANVVVNGLEKVIKVLRDNHIRVEGWGYSYLGVDPIAEAKAVAEACNRYEVSMYLIDVEKEVEGHAINSERFINLLRTLLPNTALGLNTFWDVDLHPLFPWKEYMERVDFVCPQVYWRGSEPVEKLKISQQTYSDLAKRLGVNVPMPLVAGDMFAENGLESTPEQLTEFLDATQADTSIQGIFMWASDQNETTSPLWKVFSAYSWRGVSIPQQPIGWGQSKVSLYVRAAPKGAKIGGLVKNQIVPIWNVENNWGAINPNRQEWVYIGNPNYIRTAIDVPPPPPVPAGLYKAVVNVGAGLKVRETPYGTQVGVLRYKELVQVYEEKDGWARIDAEKSHWVSARYLTKVA